MSLTLLFRDELKVFYKSNVMILLWIGLPISTLFLHFLAPPDFGKEISFSFVVSSVISNIGGILASIMLAVYIIHEKSKHVYHLFLIRPVKRKDVILAKFFAFFPCVAIAYGLAFLLGLIRDSFYHGGISSSVFKGTIVLSFLQMQESPRDPCIHRGKDSRIKADLFVADRPLWLMHFLG